MGAVPAGGTGEGRTLGVLGFTSAVLPFQAQLCLCSVQRLVLAGKCVRLAFDQCNRLIGADSTTCAGFLQEVRTTANVIGIAVIAAFARAVHLVDRPVIVDSDEMVVFEVVGHRPLHFGNKRGMIQWGSRIIIAQEAAIAQFIVDRYKITCIVEMIM